MKQLAALGMLVACGPGPDEAPTPDDSAAPDETAAPDWRETWHVTGGEGTVVVVQRAQGTGPAVRQVYGMFGDTLQGLLSAPWCQAGGPCLSALPTEPSVVHESDRTGVQPGLSTWNWVGDRLQVAAVQAPITYPPDGPAWYRTQVTGGFEGTPLPLSLDGEWGPWSGWVDIPLAVDILSPNPAVALEPGVPVSLRWIAGGRDDLYLRVWGGDIERVYPLVDDGAHDFDPASVPIAPDDLNLALGRWGLAQHDVHGNTLSVLGVWEQPFSMLTCSPDDYPVGPVFGGAYFPPPPVITPAYVGVTFQGVADSGVMYDFLLDQDQDGYEELYSALAIFDVYDAAFNLLCQVYYDGSGALSTPPGVPVNGSGVIHEAWHLPLADGFSTCNAVDPAIWGTDDLRMVIESTTWSVGVGSLDLAAAPFIDAYGAQWPLVQPLVGGYYLERAGVWEEVGGMFNYRMQKCGVADSSLVAQPAPTGAPVPLRLYLSAPTYVLPLAP